MDICLFQEIFLKNKFYVDNYLSQLWQKYPAPSDTLLSAMKFALDGPSKRIRGTFCLLLSQAITGETHYQNPNSLTLASVLEIIHAYSLIHDDLPGMDDSPLRRGKPSCHIQFGEGMAILAGDALLTFAFEKLFYLDISPQNIILIGKLLSQICGAQGMVGGQALDIQLQQNFTIQESFLQTIHEKKTGELIRASIILPTYIHEKRQFENELNQFGSLLGLLFQIKDDILDALDNPSSPQKEGPNYVALLGLETTQKKADQIAKQAIHIASNLAIPHPEILINICEYLLDRDN